MSARSACLPTNKPGGDPWFRGAAGKGRASLSSSGGRAAGKAWGGAQLCGFGVRLPCPCGAAQPEGQAAQVPLKGLGSSQILGALESSL